MIKQNNSPGKKIKINLKKQTNKKPYTLISILGDNSHKPKKQNITPFGFKG